MSNQKISITISCQVSHPNAHVIKYSCNLIMFTVPSRSQQTFLSPFLKCVQMILFPEASKNTVQ